MAEERGGMAEERGGLNGGGEERNGGAGEEGRTGSHGHDPGEVFMRRDDDLLSRRFLIA